MPPSSALNSMMMFKTATLVAEALEESAFDL